MKKVKECEGPWTADVAFPIKWTSLRDFPLRDGVGDVAAAAQAVLTLFRACPQGEAGAVNARMS